MGKPNMRNAPRAFRKHANAIEANKAGAIERGFECFRHYTGIPEAESLPDAIRLKALLSEHTGIVAQQEA